MAVPVTLHAYNIQDHQFQTQLLLRRNTLVELVIIHLNVKIIFPRKYFVSQLLSFQFHKILEF